MALPEPLWEIAELFPEQGAWTEESYMQLPGNRLIELSNGIVDILPVPSQRHQKILLFLSGLLIAFCLPKNLGQVLVAPFKIRLWKDKVREPDVVFMLAKNSHRRFEHYWQGADLVMEIVSSDDPKRDLVIKKEEYAKAGIPEYWLVNPIDETMTVFTLGSLEDYQEGWVYSRGQQASRFC